MTISRKLLIAGALLVGMQQIALPHTSQVACEVSQMLNFAQTLHHVNHKDALRVHNGLKSKHAIHHMMYKITRFWR